ncbi:MAG: bile acid:sodium symporter [Gammaproteobacteria bacterium]
MIGDYMIPLVVIMMMVVVGMELTLEDFRRVRTFPKPVFIGTAGQLIVLPVITTGLAWAFDPPPFIVAGMVLVAACPGGAISNYYVYLAHADVALSVTLTAVSTVFAFITLPLLTALGFDHLLGQQAPISVPVGHMMSQLFLVLLVPTAAGMWIRQRWTAFVKCKGALLRRISVGCLVALVAFVIQDQAGNLGAQIGSLFVITVLFTLLAMTAGAATAWGLRLKPHDRFVFLVEYSARNLAIATVVGVVLLGHTEFVVFAAAFFIIQVPLLLAAVMLRRMKSAKLMLS